MSVQISIEWIKANAAFVSSRIVKLERENADLRAKLARLDGLTNWVCSCGGTDCKGQEENAALRNEVDEQARLNGKGAERELALRANVETLERENAALRADTERLDWLESVAKDLICTRDDRGITIGVASNFQNYATNAATFRSAIDAARKEQPCQS